MEIWDLYDEKGALTGKTHVRGEQIPEGYYHLVVHVWIKNSKGEYLISQRSADRPSHPLMWECVGGSVTVGESSLMGALRETKEEVGIDLLPENGSMVRTVTRGVVNGVSFADILHVWRFDYNGEADLSKATTKEVADVKWMTVEEIRALKDSGRLVPTLGYFFTEII